MQKDRVGAYKFFFDQLVAAGFQSSVVVVVVHHAR